MTDFSTFIETNGAFLLSFFGLLGGGISYILIFCLKSRCSEISCCGCKLVRTPIPLEQLGNVNLELPNNNIVNNNIP
jgi:hypothetical protein